jgi:hypothetical protein
MYERVAYAEEWGNVRNTDGGQFADNGFIRVAGPVSFIQFLRYRAREIRVPSVSALAAHECLPALVAVFSEFSSKCDGQPWR